MAIVGLANSQNSTYSPYSRYGLGEMAPSTFAHNLAMGGANIALKPDSTMPVFINSGNPAAYALIKLTTLEVGGRFLFSNFQSGGNSLNKWGTNFSYGALGFPIKGNGGMCFGVTPYSYVGYETQTTITQPVIGDVNYKFNGDGGLSKAFLGYGVMPFNKRLAKFRRKHLYVPDSLKTLSHNAYRLGEFGSKMLSDFSIGFNVNYLFGSLENVTRVIYPNSLLYNNTFRERITTLGDFTGNFGAQTAITIDSVRKSGGHRRALREKVKFTFGFFAGLNNTLKASYNTAAYNYIINGSGQEIIRDTAFANFNQAGKITLPLEEGFGIGFKKGEKLNIVADFAITGWSKFKYLNDVTGFKDSYRIAAGINYVPEKYASGRGSFTRRINYRFGVSYNSGFISLQNTQIDDKSVSLGFGIPVGANRFVSSMVNVGLQVGQMGTTSKNLVQQNYFKVNFGFSFSDRWFQKFRYD
jgi:hypothetical protein